MKKIKDASSLFLWEDSGDSEVERLLSHSNYELQESNNVDDDDDHDDARSCSCDDYYTSEQLTTLDHNFHDDGDLVVGLIDNHRSDELDGGCGSRAGSEYNSDEDEEEEESSNNNYNNNVGGVIQNMNEMEDRVFWDTCMAEGYP